MSPPVPVATATLDALFKGGYGVRASDLFFGRGGWDLPIPPIAVEANSFKALVARVPQGDSPIISPLTYDPTGSSFALAAAAPVPVVETSLTQIDATNQSDDTTDPDMPPVRVARARIRLKDLVDDVGNTVSNQDERNYQSYLLNSALNFVIEEERNGITADNAIAILEDFQLHLQPFVQGSSTDPVAQTHMAETSKIVNPLNTGRPDDAPIHHRNP